jgi:Uma2 family endonuclease
MAYTAQKILTFETFLDRYCDNFRYEFADGELVDRSPTGPHETVSGKLATQIGMAIAAEKLPWFLPLRCCTILNKLFMNRLSGLSHKKIHSLWNRPESLFLRMVQDVSSPHLFDPSILRLRYRPPS